MELSGAATESVILCAERTRVVGAASHSPAEVRLFCLVLRWTGIHISEALALTPAAIDIDGGAAVTLKRRRSGMIRQVPLPPDLSRDLEEVFGLREAQRDSERA
jgi:integrase/recombinase XerD